MTPQEKKAMTPQDHDLSRKRDEEIIPVAMEILKYIAGQENLAKGLGSHVKNEDRIAVYEPIVLKILGIALEKNLKIKDASYLFQILHQALQFTDDTFQASLAQQFDRADAHKWGVEDLRDIRIQTVDKYLVDEVDAKA